MYISSNFSISVESCLQNKEYLLIPDQLSHTKSLFFYSPPPTQIGRYINDLSALLLLLLAKKDQLSSCCSPKWSLDQLEGRKTLDNAAPIAKLHVPPNGTAEPGILALERPELLSFSGTKGNLCKLWFLYSRLG